ncbi:MAG: transcription termination/antitermination protein NusG [bacterium]
MAVHWYVLHTYSGQEEKVKKSLEHKFKTMHLEEKLQQILIPKQEITEIKKGEKKISSRMYFPGYLFIEMELTDDSWYAVRNTQGISGFISTHSKPTPLTEIEVKKIMLQVEEKKKKFKIVLEKGNSVKIISGPFVGFTGIIDEINEEKFKLKVLVTIFGRSTPIEIDTDQVEREEI